jgi:hypothetical protein
MCSILSRLSKHKAYSKVTDCSVLRPGYHSTRPTSRWQCARYTVLSKHQDYVKVTVCSVYCPIKAPGRQGDSVIGILSYQSTRTTSRWQCVRYTALTIKAPGLRQGDSVLGILSYQRMNAQSSTWRTVDTLLTRKSSDLDFLSLAR